MMWVPALATAFAAIVNIPVNLLLIKFYGFPGAAAAFSVTRVLLFLFLIGKPATFCIADDLLLLRHRVYVRWESAYTAWTLGSCVVTWGIAEDILGWWFAVLDMTWLFTVHVTSAARTASRCCSQAT